MTSELRRLRDDRSHGFTLVEVLVVVSLLGLVSAVIAAAFVVVVRTNPASEARADDARALLSLTNLLSQDVASTAENGFELGDTDGNPAIDSAPTACAAGSVPTSQGLLQLRWGSFVANYRWVPSSPGKGRIVRYACVNGGTPLARTLSAELDQAPAAPGTFAPAPVQIVTKPTQSGNPGYGGIEFQLFVYDNGVQRELLQLDASTRNVQTALPPGGGSGGSGSGPNTPPTGQDLIVDIEANQTVSVSPVLIDDVDNDVLLVNLDASAMPNNWSAPTLTYINTLAECSPVMPGDPGCWKFAATAPNSATAGDEYVLPYRVCDRPAGDPDRECSPYYEVTLRVVDPAPTPPSASPFTIDVQAGDPVADVLLPITDAGGLNGLTISFKNPVPNGWSPTTVYGTISSVTGWYLSFATSAADSVGTYTLQYQADDGNDSTGWVDITVDVTAAPVDNPPDAGPVSASVPAASAATVILPVTDEDPSTLAYEFRNEPSGWNPLANSSAVMSFTTNASNVGAYTFEYRVRDAGGQYNPLGWVEVTITVTNQTPSAAPVSRNATKSVPVSIDLPISDAEETLSAGQVSISLPNNQWSSSIAQSGSTVTATITPSSSASGVNPITYTVTDSSGQSATATITLTVCTVNSITFSPTSNTVDSSNHLGATQQVTISTNGACGSLVALFNPANFSNNNNNASTCTPNGPTTAWKPEPFNSATSITIGTSAYTWQRPNAAQTRYFCFVLRQGVNGANELGSYLAVTQ